MVYENQAEMDEVPGKLDNNSFILNQDNVFKEYQQAMTVSDTKMEFGLI